MDAVDCSRRSSIRKWREVRSGLQQKKPSLWLVSWQAWHRQVVRADAGQHSSGVVLACYITHAHLCRQPPPAGQPQRRPSGQTPSPSRPRPLQEQAGMRSMRSPGPAAPSPALSRATHYTHVSTHTQHPLADSNNTHAAAPVARWRPQGSMSNAMRWLVVAVWRCRVYTMPARRCMGFGREVGLVSRIASQQQQHEVP